MKYGFVDVYGRSRTEQAQYFYKMGLALGIETVLSRYSKVEIMTDQEYAGFTSDYMPKKIRKYTFAFPSHPDDLESCVDVVPIIKKSTGYYVFNSVIWFEGSLDVTVVLDHISEGPKVRKITSIREGLEFGDVALLYDYARDTAEELAKK